MKSTSKLAIQILEKHAPEIAQGKIDAEFSDAIRKAIRDELLRRKLGNSGIDAINDVLSIGNATGLWYHEGLESVRSDRTAQSRLKSVDATHTQFAYSIIGKIFEFCETVTATRNADVLAGAAIASGALLGAILKEESLRQLVDMSRKTKSQGAISWMYIHPFTGGNHAKEEGDYRRIQYLDRCTTFIRSQLEKALPAGRPISAEGSLKAFANEVGIKRLTLKTLLQIAQGYWALRLESWQVEYLINPYRCPSLDERTWIRFLSGNAKTQIGPTQDNELLEKPTQRDLRYTTATQNADASRKALAGLIRCFRRPVGDKKTREKALADRIQAWEKANPRPTFWLSVFHHWLCDNSIWRPGGAYGQQHRLHPPGLYRYCHGFAYALFHHVSHIDVTGQHLVRDFRDAFLRTLDSIKRSKSSAPGATGLRSFLQYAIKLMPFGTPLNVQDEDLLLQATPLSARTRVITPADYKKARALIDHRFGEFPVNCLRFKVILSMAWRLGTRWRETIFLRVEDVDVTHPRSGYFGSIYIESNEHFDSKTRSSIRRLELNSFVPQHELREYYEYLHKRRAFIGSASRSEQFLFGDYSNLNTFTDPEHIHQTIQEILREVTRDNRVVFHDLRHSAGTFLLLRMYAETLDGNPFSFLPGMSELTEGFNLANPLSIEMTGLQLKHPSRLFAAAQVLGHVTPESFMDFYCHLADLVVSAQVRQSTELPAKVRSILEGTSVDSIQRRDRRRKARGLSTEAPLVTPMARGNGKGRVRIDNRNSLGKLGGMSFADVSHIVRCCSFEFLSDSRRIEIGLSEIDYAEVRAICQSWPLVNWYKNERLLISSFAERRRETPFFDGLRKDVLALGKLERLEEIKPLKDAGLLGIYRNSEKAREVSLALNELMPSESFIVKTVITQRRHYQYRNYEVHNENMFAISPRAILGEIFVFSILFEIERRLGTHFGQRLEPSP